jgi:hypothetical protein
MWALFSACAGSAGAPDADPSATLVVVDGTPVCPEAGESAAAMLMLGDQRREGLVVSVSRDAGPCSLSSHPGDTVFVPRRVLLVEVGQQPELTLDEAPAGLTGFAWQPDFSSLDEVDRFNLEIPLDGRRNTTSVDIEMDAATTQSVALGELPPGRYVLEVNAEWPDGSSGYTFQVEVVEP